MELNFRTSLLLIALFALVASAGCAQKEVQKNIDYKVSEQTNGEKAQSPQERVTQLIDESKITEQQKSALRSLQKQTQKELLALTDEYNKVRTVLLEDLFAEEYNAKEIMALKRRVRSLTEKRLTIIFNAMDKMNDILERDIEAKKRISPHMLDIPVLKWSDM